MTKKMTKKMRKNRKTSTKKAFRRGIRGGNNVSSSYPNTNPNTTNPDTPASNPTLQSNLTNIGNLLVTATNNLVANGIDKGADWAGIDTNKTVKDNVREIGDKFEKVAQAMDTPAGQKLKQETGKLLRDSVVVLKPAIEEAEDIALEGFDKVLKTGSKMALTAANELFPPLFALNELSYATTAASQTGETVAKLTTLGAESVQKLENEKKRAEMLWEQGKALVNQTVATGVEGAQSWVDGLKAEVPRTLPQKQIPLKPLAPQRQIPLKPTVTSFKGGALKKVQRDASIIGGRVNDSKMEFLKLS